MEKDNEFHLGSLTKAMLATLIGLLVDQGRISWETTIPEALPELDDFIAQGHRNTAIAMLGWRRRTEDRNQPRPSDYSRRMEVRKHELCYSRPDCRELHGWLTLMGGKYEGAPLWTPRRGVRF